MVHIFRRHGSARTLGAALVPMLLFAACNDDPTDPGAIPELVVESSATSFADTDPAIGTDETIIVELRNAGGSSVTVSEVTLAGPDAHAFVVVASPPVMLGAGQAQEVRIAFAPSTEGDKSAVLSISSNDPARPRVDIALRGGAARFQYRQVDRIGIPGLNTVFNHPSGTAGFDKTAYNTSAPSGDLTTYTGQFETVLGAVGNADPSATAALLLPDELPVSLAASPTAFAMLTGRALSDDAVDVALSVTVGIAELQSDNVDANDREFRMEFPYVAAPHN